MHSCAECLRSSGDRSSSGHHEPAGLGAIESRYHSLRASERRARFGSVLPVCRGRVECILVFRASRSDAWGALSAWRGRPAGTPFGFFGMGAAGCYSCYGRCLVSVARRLSHRLAGRWYARYPGRGVVSRGAGNVSSWPPPPVGRGSWGSMPLAARHTAISPMSAVGWAPATAQAGGRSAWQAWSWTWLERSATSWD